MLATGKFNPDSFLKKKSTFFSISDLENEYMRYLRNRGKAISKKSITAYQYNINILKNIFGQEYEIHKITPKSVENEIMFYLNGRFKSQASCSHCLRHFRAVFYKAVEWKMIPENPFSGKVKKIEKKQPRYLKQYEIEKMTEYFERTSIPKWQGELVFFTLNTGLRKEEVFNLTWDNIDLINQNLCFKGKGGKERFVPLNNNAINILGKLNKRIDNPRVFYEINNSDSISSAWRTFKRRTGIKVRFHDLRSTYASYYMMNGGSIMRLKEILGHEDIKTTIDSYAVLARENLHKDKNIVAF
jgi:integrase